MHTGGGVRACVLACVRSFLPALGLIFPELGEGGQDRTTQGVFGEKIPVEI